MKIIEQSQFMRKAKDKVYEDVFEKYDLTSNELSIIMHLKNSENNTASDIANEFLFAKSHVSASIDGLVRKGYLRKVFNSDNKKVQRLTLTDKSDEVVLVATKKQKEFIKLMFEGVSREDKKTTEKVLKKMHKNVMKVLEGK